MPTSNSPPMLTFHTPSAPSSISTMPGSSADPAPPPHLTPSKVMPGCSHHSTPKFDRKPWSLKWFLTEDYKLWLSLKSATGDIWDPFVAELCALYPGSEGNRKYNHENLGALTRSSQNSSYNVHATTTPHAQPSQQQSIRPDVCIFCSDLKHYQFDCAKAADYIQRGLMMRNATNSLVLPNGARIMACTSPGHNIMEHIDSWHCNNPPAQSAPIASTNFIDIVVTSKVNDLTNPWAVFMHEVSSTSCIKEVPNHKEASTVELSASNPFLVDVVDIFGPTTHTQSYDTPAPAPANKGKVYKGPPHLPIPTMSVANILPPVTVGALQVSAPPHTSKNPFISSANLQYMYYTLIESPETVERVVDQSLDATVMLTNRDLLSVAPEVRKPLKNQIAMR
ncbi:hypothetical protein HYPSUDRAFT_208594 [Hypholoma sublateritium FD-334 SS-4]|uniref:CCHC-type domain-containing protein n=1 Tax=Hypholoma sublateritium (strain FD-334 SS-4) TaxID=945553 RepID=A0A0D2P1Q5_HYPSF|nr:hypothetical protein HYPSUDRAFT_208594 [Hypholoma sublateritium FD-334 SS-4]